LRADPFYPVAAVGSGLPDRCFVAPNPSAWPGALWASRSRRASWTAWQHRACRAHPRGAFRRDAWCRRR